jgi:two-component system phosphate regulon sensor histidine kinase PhoR
MRRGRRDREGEMNRNGHRPPKRWVLYGILIFHIGMALSWVSAYYLMEIIAKTWFPNFGHTIVRQYLTLILATTLAFIIINLVRLFFRPVRRQMNWLLQLINAMKQLAQGNFDVNLQANPRFMGQFGPLVKTFNEMATELSQMEEMRQEFISNVSHEIQSPLTSIAGFARALHNEELTPETRLHYLNIIETESKRLSRMSDNLLKLTSLESKHQPFEPMTYRLDRQLRHIILSCEPLWQEKNIEMDVELPETTITADEDLMNQVWINLLHNSIKFTPDGGTITLRLASPEEDLIRIIIKDTGIGISEEALPHLFERFYKADKARDRSGGGSGLGLSIVHKIIEIHGGRISVSSQTGEGSTFTVDCPLRASVSTYNSKS